MHLRCEFNKHRGSLLRDSREQFIYVAEIKSQSMYAYGSSPAKIVTFRNFIRTCVCVCADSAGCILLKLAVPRASIHDLHLHRVPRLPPLSSFLSLFSPRQRFTWRKFFSTAWEIQRPGNRASRVQRAQTRARDGPRWASRYIAQFIGHYRERAYCGACCFCVARPIDGMARDKR